MIEETIQNILDNGALTLATYENTIHLYYEGVWHSFDTQEQERLALVKPLVKMSIGTRPRAKEIDAVHVELKTEFFPLESYVEKEKIYINAKKHLLVVSKEGSIKKLPHSKELGFRWKLENDYNEEATCPLFDKYLGEVIGEEEAIKVLQEYLGYVFLPHSHLNIEKALWLVGSGSNGKSVLTALLKYLFGEQNISYLNLPELNDNEKRGMLKGKILNITQDASNRVDPSSYKTIVSGERLIFRELYKGSSVLKSVPKLIIATNELPRVVSGVDAFMRRVILIPFNKVIAEEDRDLELGEKLKGEIEGIFNFAIKGLQRLLKQKHFTQSAMIEKAILEYKGELDVLGDFLQDNAMDKLQDKASAFITQNELFKRVSEWCKSNDRKNSYSSPRKLRDKLISDYGFSAYKNNTVYGIKAKWKGLSITPVNNIAPPSPYEESSIN
ncbi:MAG: hypothetical protein GQ531_03095 [Sulfurovum sp.]|nr:hypothetical protein [Sulfurovum sp.]